MQQRIRIIALYSILAICAITVIGSLVVGKAPPEAVYGLLGTFGAYVLFGPSVPEGKRPPQPPELPPEPHHSDTGGEPG